jgi:hypothetical protein
VRVWEHLSPEEAAHQVMAVVENHRPSESRS